MVNMMDNLIREKVSFKNFLHYKTVLKNITHLSSVWMRRFENISVTIADEITSSPLRIMRTPTGITFITAIKKVYAWGFIVGFTTSTTNFNHRSII
jgi:hypothetical protein